MTQMKSIWVHALLQDSLSHLAALKTVPLSAKHEICEESSIWWELLLDIITIWVEAGLTVFNHTMNLLAWWPFFHCIRKYFRKNHTFYWLRRQISWEKYFRTHGGFDLKYSIFTGEDGEVKESSCNWKFWEANQT